MGQEPVFYHPYAITMSFLVRFIFAQSIPDFGKENVKKGEPGSDDPKKNRLASAGEPARFGRGERI
jgi:hypothetical protein